MNWTFDFRSWGISLDSYHEWQPLLAKIFPGKYPAYWNWVDITLIKLGFEHSPYKNSNEVFLGLLGFHLAITVWKATEPRTTGGWFKFRRYDKETGDEV